MQLRESRSKPGAGPAPGGHKQHDRSASRRLPAKASTSSEQGRRYNCAGSLARAAASAKKPGHRIGRRRHAYRGPDPAHRLYRRHPPLLRGSTGRDQIASRVGIMMDPHPRVSRLATVQRQTWRRQRPWSRRSAARARRLKPCLRRPRWHARARGDAKAADFASRGSTLATVTRSGSRRGRRGSMEAAGGGIVTTCRGTNDGSPAAPCQETSR
jgi:hypothetical protein